MRCPAHGWQVVVTYRRYGPGTNTTTAAGVVAMAICCRMGGRHCRRPPVQCRGGKSLVDKRRSRIFGSGLGRDHSSVQSRVLQRTSQ